MDGGTIGSGASSEPGGTTARPASTALTNGAGSAGVELLGPLALALAAGFVDAVAFLHLVRAFPANQSGNLVLLGMAVGSEAVPPAWVSAVAVTGFAVGIVLAGLAARRLDAGARALAVAEGQDAAAVAAAGRDRRPVVLLAVEALLLGALAGWVALVGTDPLEGLARATFLGIAAVAMGVQTVAIRRAAEVDLATTYETGALARIGDAVVHLLGGGGGGGGDGGGRASLDAAERRRHGRTVLVLGAVVALYVGGAAVGSTALGRGRTALVVPVLLVAVVLVVEVVRTGGRRRWRRAA